MAAVVTRGGGRGERGGERDRRSASGLATRAFRRPALPVALVIAVGTALLYVASVARVGSFVYCVDDAYIHLALAKNLAQRGVYGVRPDAFAAASSSILWPWLLAAVERAFGSAYFAPLALNAAAALGLGALVVRVLVDDAPAASSRSAALGALVVVWLAAILPVVFVGMEHVPHALAMLALAHVGSREATRPAAVTSSPRRAALALGLLAALAASLRYETWFLAAPLALLLAARGRRVLAAAVAIGAALPAGIYAAYAHAHAAPWLPMSVILKRTHVPVIALPEVTYRHLVENPHALVTLVLVAAAWAWRRPRAGLARDALQVFLVLAFVTLSGHVALAQLGWFFRYEAYALVLALTGVVAAALEGQAALFRARAFFAPLALLLLPLVARGAGALRAVPLASGNIADQQVAMARFFDEAFPRTPIALNDIGAVAYLASSPPVDLMGLGSPEVAALRGFHIDEGLDRARLEAITRAGGFPVAAVYEAWFAGAIPSSWVPVGRWHVADNRVCAEDTITFYAVTSAGPAGDPTRLAQRLARFAPRLSRRVTYEPIPLVPRPAAPPVGGEPSPPSPEFPASR